MEIKSIENKYVKNYMILKLFLKDIVIFILCELDLWSNILYFYEVR